jgi:hypothetical protein
MEPHNILKESSKRIQLFSKVSLHDYLQLESRNPPSYSILYSYLTTLTPINQSFSNPLSQDCIIFEPSHTTVLQSKSILILYVDISGIDSLSSNLKNQGKEVHSYKIPSSYTLISLIKLWLKFKSDLKTFIDKLNYSALAEESAKELELFICREVGVDRVMRLKEELGNFRRIEKVDRVICLKKPVTDLEVKHSDSLRYTESEETDQMEELNFRVSDLFREKFPRFSAASITVMDTPVKEVRKSFLEYNELIESPKNHRGNYVKTPLDSPKQASLTIDQVKERLESSSSPQHSFKEHKKFDFESEVIKSLNTELTGCSEVKPLFPFESKTRSCQCSSCSIF